MCSIMGQRMFLALLLLNCNTVFGNENIDNDDFTTSTDGEGLYSTTTSNEEGFKTTLTPMTTLSSTCKVV